MQISEKDFEEASRISSIVQLIDKMDTSYVDTESTIVYKKQPFLLSLLLGYTMDLERDELDEIMKVIFMIWEYFKDNTNIQKHKVTEQQFEKIQLRNIHMLKYFEGETDQFEQNKILESDIGHLSSKALLTLVLFRFNEREVLVRMNIKTKGIILIGMKTLIECFDEIV